MIKEAKQAVLEKQAARAWKRVIGNLSDKARDMLISKGILNHEKELAGLHKGTNNILERYNAIVTRNTNHGKVRAQMADALRPNEKALSRLMGGMSFDEVVDMAASAQQPSGYMYSVVSKGLKQPALNYGKIKRSPFFKPSMKGGQSLEDRYLKAVVKRHEADEVRYGMQSLNNPRKHVDIEGGKIPLTQYGSHLSPKVMFRESQNISVAPKGTKRAMKNIRENLTFESHGMKQYGHDYGKSGIYDRVRAKKLERDQGRAVVHGLNEALSQ